jgi:hypothetical protein
MKKGIVTGGIILIILISIFSCEKEFSQTALEIKPKITTDQSILSKRVIQENKELHWKSGTGMKGMSGMTFTQIGSISSPLINGNHLQACYASIDDGSEWSPDNIGPGIYAYIAYNTAGAEYGGGYDFLDARDLYGLVLGFHAYFTDIDFAVIQPDDYDNNRVLLSGGSANPVAYPTLSSPAVLFTHNFIFDENHLLGGPNPSGIYSVNINMLDLHGTCVNGINSNEDYHIITTGINGGVTFFDDEYVPTGEGGFVPLNSILALTDRSSRNDGGNRFTLCASGKVYYRDFSMPFGSGYPWSGYLNNEIQFSGCSNIEAKHSITENKNTNRVFAALGDGGLMIYDYVQEEVVFSMAKPPTESGGEYWDYVTNGVVWENEYVFVANGAAGLTVLKEYLNTYIIIGTLDLVLC